MKKVEMPCGQVLEEEVKFFYNPKDKIILQASAACIECCRRHTCYNGLEQKKYSLCYKYKLAGVVQLAER